MNTTTTSERARRALSSLSALAVGDAFGSQFFVPDNRRFHRGRELPPGVWEWTDDTEMAASVYLEVTRAGRVDPDRLAASFAARHDFDRGYGPATGRLLRLVREGADHRPLASGLFDGSGSWGNGAAMRVAPLGAHLADDVEAVVEQAAVSARVTHTHPEAVDGAVAVAVAAALVGRREAVAPGPFLDRVAAALPPGALWEGVRVARALLIVSDPVGVARELGNGSRVRALDTVPFALWVVAKHLRGTLASALWAAVAPGGDMDTVGAIVGGVLGAGAVGAVDPEWAARVEALPEWALT
ncbi:ADP-ribosylglycohydrolase family protein [Nocardiopsis sp. N85]|uniref:ADP-ribosylglycohydrolase family protein n=1 Tax=Nocardiopsis sp. N85 TaxID=3029400 RepID=UPI00237F15DB|nr:ADP-ribosylglycohydrolase family protein [Nocardiopsis sp. N85]MDE3722012.1 ADP-ribosylglycohydrolase family protein [Nocardiopsis sp. N85]